MKKKKSQSPVIDYALSLNKKITTGFRKKLADLTTVEKCILP